MCISSYSPKAAKLSAIAGLLGDASDDGILQAYDDNLLYLVENEICQVGGAMFGVGAVRPLFVFFFLNIFKFQDLQNEAFQKDRRLLKI